MGTGLGVSNDLILIGGRCYISERGACLEQLIEWQRATRENRSRGPSEIGVDHRAGGLLSITENLEVALTFITTTPLQRDRAYNRKGTSRFLSELLIVMSLIRMFSKEKVERDPFCSRSGEIVEDRIVY
jgi:hypothetical protein